MLSGLIFSLAACAPAASGSESQSGGSEATTQGRYVETNITPDSSQNTPYMYQGENNTLGAYSEDFSKHYESSDGGKTWKTTEGPGVKNPELSQLSPSGNYSISPQGDIFTETYSIDPTTGQSGDGKVYKYSRDGKKETFSVPELDEAKEKGDVVSLAQLKALPQNRLLLSWFTLKDQVTPESSTSDSSDSQPAASEASASSEDKEQSFAPSITGSGSALYDTLGFKSVADLKEDNFFLSTADANNFYFLSMDNKLKGFKLSDGSSLSLDKELKIPMDESFGFSQIFTDGEENFYLITAKGIFKLGVEEPEKIMDGIEYAFGNSNSVVSQILVSGKSFILALKEGDTTGFYRYDWDENAKISPENTLTIWSLRDSDFLRSVIALYKKTNPDVYVKLEVALAEDSAQTVDDAIRSLNTRLLAGSGPDILLLDNTPIESYISQGLLENIESLIDVKDIYSNLIDAYKTDKGIFALPGRFKLPLLSGAQSSVENIKTIEDFIKAVEAGSNASPAMGSTDLEPTQESGNKDNLPFTSFSDFNEWFDLLFATSASGIFQNQQIDKAQLEAFLAGLKKVSDHYKLTEKSAEGGMGVVFGSGAGDATALSGSASGLLMEQSQSAAYLAENLLTLRFLAAGKGMTNQVFNGYTPGSFKPTNILAMSASSKVKSHAENFIKAAFSPEAQGVRVSGGLPVSQKGMEKQIEAVKQLDLGQSVGESSDLSVDFNKLLANLTTPFSTDETLTNTVKTTAEKYCRGEMSLEEAVKKIEQDSKNYLAERR